MPSTDKHNASHTHVCLISEQPIANLLPLFLEKPQQAIFLVSPEMTNQAERLKNLARPRGITVKFEVIDSAYDFAAITRLCEDIISAGQKEENITLNVTGGTKITALAAFQSFFFNNKRIIYLDSGHNQLLQLAPETITTPVADNLVKVADYLTAYGMNPLPGSFPAQRTRRPKLKELTTLLTSNTTLLSKLNSTIDRCGKRPMHANIDLNGLGRGADDLANLLVHCGVADLTSSANLNIPSPETIFFCQGGWLEEYVYWSVKDLGIKGLDVAMNVRVQWDGTGKQSTKNEFDILFTHCNRLYMISCKSSNPERETDAGTRATEALNELDTLADRAGGLFGRAMLVSARKLSIFDHERAQKMNIEVREEKELCQFPEYLRAWLQ